MNETPASLVDLHCHSSASGGAVGTPPDIAAFFTRHGYAAFALTEHQNIRSLPAACEAAEREGIEYVNGVEMSVRVDDPDAPDRGVDVVGLLFEPTAELERLAEEGLERATEWVRTGLARLRERGVVDVSEEELRAGVRKRFGARDVWKRPYGVVPLGVVLLERGLVRENQPRSVNDQVRDLLHGVYPESERPPLPEVGYVCDVLARAGAVRILAHPGGGRREPSDQQQRRLEWWLDRYVDGIEVYTRKHLPAYEQMALEVTRRRGRPFSGGSDSHSYHDDGTFSKAPYACLESLREFKAAR